MNTLNYVYDSNNVYLDDPDFNTDYPLYEITSEWTTIAVGVTGTAVNDPGNSTFRLNYVLQNNNNAPNQYQAWGVFAQNIGSLDYDLWTD
jgi:hypothetical protein